MHNIHLVGNGQPLDKFNIRSSVIVVGIFGVILIISYFNELARAGLLSKHRFTPYRNHVSRRESGPGDVILHNDGDIHHLELDLKPLHNILRGGNASQDDNSDKKEINIKLHIGKNSSYLLPNSSSSIRIYQQQNIVPNFYLRFNNLMNGSVLINSVTSSELLKRIASERKKTAPHNATAVFMYQYEPGGYALQECLKKIAEPQGLRIGNDPLNGAYRNEWEKMPTSARSRFQVLYGGLSFGSCEGIDHTCSYSTFLLHPIDRILQVYAMCKKKVPRSMCHLGHMNISNSTVLEFIKSEGNNLFQKLMYYSRHCKLVGDDELCIHDKQAFFLLTAEEKATYLQNVLENLPKWFRTVGLVHQWDESIALFDFTYGLNFTKCFRKMYQTYLPALRGIYRLKKNQDLYTFVSSKLRVGGKPYLKLREELLNSTEVNKLLYADLAIYGKFEEIFKSQVQVYQSIKRTVPDAKLRTTTSNQLSTSLQRNPKHSKKSGEILEAKKAKEGRSEIYTPTSYAEYTVSKNLNEKAFHSGKHHKKPRVEKKKHHHGNNKSRARLNNSTNHARDYVTKVPEIHVNTGTHILKTSPGSRNRARLKSDKLPRNLAKT